MSRPLRIGVQLPPGGVADYATWRAAVRKAEDLGVDIVFGYDHFYLPVLETTSTGRRLARVQPDGTHFEGWTALASWGEITHRAEIGLLVTGIGYRNPDLLADMARTVDHISGGRLVLGLGAGWYPKDYVNYGYDYGTWSSRFDLFDESLDRIEARMKQLDPPPVRPIPILIGGSGPKRTLPTVARHADIWHNALGVTEFVHASQKVDELAEKVGRSGSEIERAITWTGTETADAYHLAGVTTFITEIRPDPPQGGFDFQVLHEMLAWRDRQS